VLARSLNASSAGFVILESDEASAVQARQQGHLCVQGDATSESALHAAGVTRAHALATVLSNDALNVFITLSARALNPNLSIVARGEVASTESKLLHAGADKVVLPTHIGAERIAELLLHEESARFIEGLERSHGFQRVLHNFGMERDGDESALSDRQVFPIGVKNTLVIRRPISSSHLTNKEHRYGHPANRHAPRRTLPPRSI
jgi:voltage-gated potassium channel